MKISNSYDEREFDIRELLQVVIKKIWLVLLVGISLSIIIFLIDYYVIDWTYESTTQIYVVSKQDNETQISYEDMQTSIYLIEDFKVLVTSRLVTEQVINKLKLDMKHEDLIKLIHLENPEGTRVLFIKVDYKNPVIAKQIADAVRDSATDMFSGLTYNNHVIRIIVANLPDKPLKPNIKHNTILGGALGIMISSFLILLHHLSDKKMKTVSDIEKNLDLKVLSVIKHQKKRSFWNKVLKRKHKNKKVKRLSPWLKGVFKWKRLK